MALRSVPDIFDAFGNLKVLIIGDVMVDTYIYGSVRRISPEAPVPVVSILKQEKRLGGAANVALNIQALGATPILCSIVGDDQAGEDFRFLLRQQGITEKGIIKSGGRSTTIKQRVLSGSQHLLRLDTEMDTPLSPIDKKALISHIGSLMSEVDAVIFEDYDKGCLDEEVIRESIALAKAKGIPTAVDPKRRNFFHYNHCTLFKPNLKELAEAMGQELDAQNGEHLLNATKKLADRMNFEQALVTLSENGIYYYSEDKQNVFPAHRRAIADVSGAGDTIISIAALCLALKLPLSFIAELANLGGGIVCEYQGVAPIVRDRLLQEASNSRILADELI